MFARISLHALHSVVAASLRLLLSGVRLPDQVLLNFYASRFCHFRWSS
jgi:hypothetical protein